MSSTIYLAVVRRRGPAWNHAVPMRAQALWAEHAAFMNALVSERVIVLGGPIGTGEETLLIFAAERIDHAVHAAGVCQASAARSSRCP